MNDLPPGLGAPNGPRIDLPAPPAEPWERQPRESDQAWALFQFYRDSAYPKGVGEGYVVRSLPAMARAGQWDIRDLRRIAQAYDWNNRCIQYDRLIDRERTAEALDALPKIQEDHRRILQELRRLVQDQVTKWAETCFSAATPQVKMRELKSLLEVAVKLDRLVHGEATEIVKLQDQWDLAGLNIDQLRELKAMAEQTGGKVQGV